VRLEAPGWPWLLAHELRLAWRAGKGRAIRMGILLGIFWLLMHAAAWFLMRTPEKIVAGQGILLAGAITWFVLLLAVATSFGLAVVALFERGDLDLLLSSPIAPRTVFAVRGLGVAVQAIAMVAVFWLPFANGAILHGYWRFAASYPAIVSLALGATAVAFAATLALARAFGVRRAKVIAQILGAVAGAIMFLASQASGLLPDDARHALAEWFRGDAAQKWLGESSVLWTPTRAVFGDPVALVATLAVGVGAFFAVVLLCERLFLESTREAEGARPVSGGAARSGRPFRSGLGSIVVLKELRLLRRDPKLISQSLLQVLYLIPLVLIGLRHGTLQDMLAPVVILIVATLAGNLAWMTVSGEEAPDLLGSAPVPKQALLWLKVAAAIAPPLVLCVPFTVLFAMQSFKAFVIFTVCLAGALASSAVIQAWNARPGSGRDLKKRMQSGKLTNLVEFVGAAGWAGAAFAFLHGWLLGLVGVAAGLAAAALAWAIRPDPLSQEP
jgi:ABC-2 type transport system permease protein